MLLHILYHMSYHMLRMLLSLPVDVTLPVPDYACYTITQQTIPTNMSSVTQFIECQERTGKRMKNEKIKTSVRGRERIE